MINSYYKSRPFNEKLACDLILSAHRFKHGGFVSGLNMAVECGRRMAKPGFVCGNSSQAITPKPATG
jgi:hypothetical protein